MAKDRGAYKAFKGSKWDQAIFFGKEKRMGMKPILNLKDEWNEAFYLVEANWTKKWRANSNSTEYINIIIDGINCFCNSNILKVLHEKNQEELYQEQLNI